MKEELNDNIKRIQILQEMNLFSDIIYLVADLKIK